MSDHPVHATAQVEIAAAPAIVWQVLAAVNDWPQWYPDIGKVEASGPLHTGATFGFKTGPVTVSATVDEGTPGQRLRFTGTSRGTVAMYDFLLTRVGEETTVRAEQSMSGLAVKAMRPMLQKIAETSLPAWLGALKARVESTR